MNYEELLCGSGQNKVKEKAVPGSKSQSKRNKAAIRKNTSRQQKFAARLWAYNKQIGLMGIIQAFEAGCSNKYEIAEHLGVTEEFLQEALVTYRQKYGFSVTVDNYMIVFHDGLSVVKMI